MLATDEVIATWTGRGALCTSAAIPKHAIRVNSTAERFGAAPDIVPIPRTRPSGWVSWKCVAKQSNAFVLVDADAAAVIIYS